MDLNDFKAAFTLQAERLGDYRLLSKTELANGYCDAEDALFAAQDAGDKNAERIYDDLRSSYFAALMLRYWSKIYEWKVDSFTLGFDDAEYVTWLSDSIWVAFYYKAWRHEYKATYKFGRFIDWKRDESGNLIPNDYWYEIDPVAPDRIINTCCASMRGRIFQYNNKDKRRTNIRAKSLEQMTEEAGDGSTATTKCFEPAPTYDGVSDLIRAMVKRGDLVEALIIDGIAYRNTFKTEKYTISFTAQNDENELVSNTATRQSDEFDPRRLVKHLSHITPSFMQQFCSQYAIEEVRGNEIYMRVSGMSNPKLYKCIEKTLIQLRENPKLLSYLC